jgi:hypothetical protein
MTRWVARSVTRRTGRCRRVQTVIEFVCAWAIATTVAVGALGLLGQCGCARTLDYCEDGSCAGAGGAAE